MLNYWNDHRRLVRLPINGDYKAKSADNWRHVNSTIRDVFASRLWEVRRIEISISFYILRKNQSHFLPRSSLPFLGSFSPWYALFFLFSHSIYLPKCLRYVHTALAWKLAWIHAPCQRAVVLLALWPPFSLKVSLRLVLHLKGPWRRRECYSCRFSW